MLFNSRLLYVLTIFFLPFSATAVINIGLEGEGSAIQPYMFFGVLWLTLYFMKTGSSGKINRIEFKPILFLSLFAFIALISLFMPLYIHGTESGNVSGKLGEVMPINFSSKNITQYFYLLFGIVFSIALYFYNKDQDNYKRTLKVYGNSVIFVMVWGVLELTCSYLGISYPAVIFNNSYSSSAGGFQAILDGESGLKRISSVAVESSILVQSVAIFLPFLIMGQFDKIYYYSKRYDRIYIVLLVLFILRSTSTSGIISLLFLSMFFVLMYFRTLTYRKKLNFVVMLAIVVPLAGLTIFTVFNDFIQKTLLSKGESYSALERSSAIIGAWDNFLHYPLLGTGWGSVTSFDLFIRILSNSGVIGATFFILFLFHVIYNYKNSNVTLDQFGSYKKGTIISFILLIFMNAINGFSFTYGYFWLIIGISIIMKFTASDQKQVSNINMNE